MDFFYHICQGGMHSSLVSNIISQIDVCASASCGDHGSCTSRYLGGLLPVDTSLACICEDGWFGETCSINPCDTGDAAIPTLSEWGMIIFMTMLLGIGVVTILRRRMI